MTTNIIIAGFGGQGILFAGKILAYAALLTGKHLSWLPSYGPEMRGGTANCHVIVSDEPVASPIINNPDVLIGMNKPSFDKFENTVVENGYIIIDSTLIDREIARSDVKAYAVPATKTATDAGKGNLANMVMLGALIKATGIFTLEEIRKGVEKTTPASKQHLVEVNMEMIQKGYDLA
ncbi:MAG: 2-oxoacid:ferredoxin oxidoreductase subunit gamma [Ruminococcaceae bacterium]|nr:2-oxoacid:ferredoxin oxidoreductase subunit gamma [Oscillospiraceae bacterium]